ncbi:MAG: DUF2490 domain-containing protein [Winogradskyella arenosi]
MVRIILTPLLVISFIFKGFAQFSPPGLGEAHTASWFALGLKQPLNKSGTLSSKTYLGLGRISTPDRYNGFEKPAIYVFNEEVTHRFHKNWSYAGAISYRWQYQYNSTPPYAQSSPDARQELRAYSRFSYHNSVGKFNYGLSFRPELRFFYNPDFSPYSKNTQFRSRLRAKASFFLNSSKTQQFITTAEVLYATTKTDQWSTFKYQDTRFCFYYSVALSQPKLVLNVGYMTDLIGTTSLTDVHYIAFDMLLINPFKRK